MIPAYTYNPHKPPRVPLICLYQGRSFISGLIRWQTRSKYSHAAVLDVNGHILEAVEGQGVITRPVETSDVFEAFEVLGMTEGQWQLALEFGSNQIGKSYDYSSVARFVSRRAARENGKWFCSELVYAMCEYSGVNLLSRIQPHNVSPALLSMSPTLKRVYSE